MSGKIHPKKPVGGTQFGTTITDSDPAKFPNKGKEHGKTMSSKTVVPQKTGATFTCNDPAVHMTQASEYGVGKSMGQHAEKGFNPYGRKPSNVADHPVVTTPPYPLAKQYRK